MHKDTHVHILFISAIVSEYSYTINVLLIISNQHLFCQFFKFSLVVFNAWSKWPILALKEQVERKTTVHSSSKHLQLDNYLMISHQSRCTLPLLSAPFDSSSSLFLSLFL